MMLAMALGAVCTAAELRFKSAATVSEAIVRLDDVAEITAEPELTRRLAAVTLAPAPSSGRTLNLTYEMVSARLAALGIDVSQVQFSGKSTVRVTAAKPEVVPVAHTTPAPELPNRMSDATERMLGKAISAYLAKADPSLVRMVAQVTLTREQTPLFVAARKEDLLVTGGKAPWSQPQWFRVSCKDRRGKSQATDVYCKLVPMPYLLQAARALRTGEVLTAQDVKRVQVETTTATRNPPLEDESLIVGRQLQRSVAAGDIFYEGDVRPVQLVSRGDIVTVTSRVGGVTVSMEAKALSSGAQGELVELATLNNRGKLVGRVVGFHELEVQPAVKVSE